MINKVRGYLFANYYRLKHKYQLNNSKRIIIGSCYTYQKGWFATDIPEVDITSKEVCSQFWKPNSKIAFLAEHVWEHLTKYQALSI
jgi:predicted SAM-dependent methyltransferase